MYGGGGKDDRNVLYVNFSTEKKISIKSLVERGPDLRCVILRQI